MYRFSKIIWLFPFVMGLMVLGMDTTREGTDLVSQTLALSLISQDSPIELLFASGERFHGLYYAIYAALYQWVSLSPIQFISVITICNFILFILLVKSYLKKTSIVNLSAQDVNRIMLIALTSFSPIYICIARNYFAITLLFAGILFLQKRKYIIAALFIIGSLNAHEGMKLIYAIFIVAFILKQFVLPYMTRRSIRQNFIVISCVLLLMFGPILFSVVGNYMAENDMISDKFEDLYISSAAGDGIYKYVLILSMLGSLYSLIISCLANKQNDWVNAVCIAGLFMICLLINQKIFYVQRIMMLMPLFIGLSLIEVFDNKNISFSGNMLSVSLLSVPAIFLLQLFFWRNTFFSWL